MVGLLLEEFNVTIKDKKGADNSVANHLSPLRENFPDEHYFQAFNQPPWYTDIVNCLVTGNLPSNLSFEKQRKLRSDARYYFWEPPHLWKYFSN